MKKLMIVAAAALCATVFADVESSNTVGYNTLNTGDTYQMLGCTFKDVANASDSVKLSDLQGDFVSYDEIQFSYMNEGLIDFNTYQYLTTDDGVDADGWYDGSWESAADVTIPRGAAVWFISASAKGVTAAGEVVKSSTTHPAFTVQYNMICSAYPVQFNPNSATVAWSGLTSYDEIQIASVSDGLVDFTAYQWLTEDDGVEESAWYDGAWEKVASPIAAVGQGFWLVLGNPSSVTMVETSPISE